MKLLSFVIEAIYCIAVHALLIVYVGLWWNTSFLPNASGIPGNLFQAVLAIVIYSLFAFDDYRKYYKKERKLRFYMTAVSPMAFSLPGFIYGLIVVYL